MVDFSYKQDCLRKIVGVLACLSAILTAGAASGVAWMMFFDTAPPFTAGEVYTMNERLQRTDQFRAGDIMLIRRDLCFLRDTPVTFGRTLVSISPNPVNVNINSTSGMLRKGCVTNSNVVRIPDSTPAGTYKFIVTVRYSNNAFHDGATNMPAPIIEVTR